MTGIKIRVPNQGMQTRCDWTQSRQKRTGKHVKGVEKVAYLPSRSTILLSHFTLKSTMKGEFTLMMNTAAIMTTNPSYINSTIKVHRTLEDTYKGLQVNVPLTSTTMRPRLTHLNLIDRAAVTHSLSIAHPRSTATADLHLQLYLLPPIISICQRLRTKTLMGTPRVAPHVSEPLIRYRINH